MAHMGCCKFSGQASEIWQAFDEVLMKQCPSVSHSMDFGSLPLLSVLNMGGSRNQPPQYRPQTVELLSEGHPQKGPFHAYERGASGLPGHTHKKDPLVVETAKLSRKTFRPAASLAKGIRLHPGPPSAVPPADHP